MKMFVVTGLAVLGLFSCSKNEKNGSIDANQSANSNVSGLTLMEASDCMACHTTTERLIGPSYQEIAEKYSDKDIESLASKIIEGSSGVWGDVYMPSHSQLPKEDAKKMVEYILSQKK